MLIIRLQRLGRRNEPTFRVVLTDSKNGPKSGKFIEILGSYDPRDKNETKINGERVKELMANGAQLSDTVFNFLVDQKIIEGKKVNVLPKKSPIKKEGEEVAEETKAEAAPAEESTTPQEAPKVDEAPAEEAPKTDEAPAEVASEEPKAEEAPEEAPTETPVEEEKPAE